MGVKIKSQRTTDKHAPQSPSSWFSIEKSCESHGWKLFGDAANDADWKPANIESKSAAGSAYELESD